MKLIYIMSFCIICVKKLINRLRFWTKLAHQLRSILFHQHQEQTRLVSGGKIRAVPNFQPANGASNVDCLPNHLVDSCQEEGPNTHPKKKKTQFQWQWDCSPGSCGRGATIPTNRAQRLLTAQPSSLKKKKKRSPLTSSTELPFPSTDEEVS